MGLVMCSRCFRHVKRHERVCPFCGARLATSPGSAPALAAVMIGLGIAGNACSATPVPAYTPGPCLSEPDGCASGTGGAGGAGVVAGGAGGETGGGTAVPLYAAVTWDSGIETAADGGQGGATATPLYAAVAPDSSIGSGGMGAYIYASAPLPTPRPPT
jgi:hypothetical protein